MHQDCALSYLPFIRVLFQNRTLLCLLSAFLVSGWHVCFVLETPLIMQYYKGKLQKNHIFTIPWILFKFKCHNSLGCAEQFNTLTWNLYSLWSLKMSFLTIYWGNVVRITEAYSFLWKPCFLLYNIPLFFKGKQEEHSLSHPSGLASILSLCSRLL